MKSQLSKLFIIAFCALAVVSCKKQTDADGKITGVISIVSREEGSGTRGAFVELFGVLDQNKNDVTTLDAEITNNTAVMLGSIKSNKRAIGYVSMSSANDEVKSLKIDGVDANTENVVNNTYSISRPFLIATKGTISEPAQDFINFMMSNEGQEIVKKSGYISLGADKAFVSSNAVGKVIVVGSSSVAPLMEKLREAYMAVNQNTQIEIQQIDSSAGIKAVENEVCDIGMSSRPLKDSEKGLDVLTIAKDGISVIVNNENNIDNLTKEQVRSIFIGDVKRWEELN